MKGTHIRTHTHAHTIPACAYTQTQTHTHRHRHLHERLTPVSRDSTGKVTAWDIRTGEQIIKQEALGNHVAYCDRWRIVLQENHNSTHLPCVWDRRRSAALLKVDMPGWILVTCAHCTLLRAHAHKSQYRILDLHTGLYGEWTADPDRPCVLPLATYGDTALILTAEVASLSKRECDKLGIGCYLTDYAIVLVPLTHASNIAFESPPPQPKKPRESRVVWTGFDRPNVIPPKPGVKCAPVITVGGDVFVFRGV